MGLVDRFLPAKHPVFERANPSSAGTLVFQSIAALERGLDGGEERLAAYFFAIYHCGPDEREPGGITERREQLRKQFPAKAIPVGKHFVLQGEPAWLALAAYYQALSACETLGDEFRAYAKERLDDCIKAHRDSQLLPIPIDLTEGQLASDPRLEFLTCVALRNGQVYLKGT
jgi:hypothetical protein